MKMGLLHDIAIKVKEYSEEENKDLLTSYEDCKPKLPEGHSDYTFEDIKRYLFHYNKDSSKNS